ncbi:MAG: lipase [Mesorhizobium sp.]
MGEGINRRQVLTGAAALAGSSLVSRPAAAAQAPAEVYLLRGGVVGIFSTGMNDIGGLLAQRGVNAVVQGHTSWNSIASRIIMDRQKFGRAPLALVGHSFGADAVVKIAEVVRREKIPVNVLISLAATNPDPVPSNVRRAVGYYFSEHGWGLPLAAGPGFRGKLSNRDYSGDADVSHFNIDKQHAIQDEILQLVLWSVGQ